MNPKSKILERFVYALVIVLLLIVLGLVALSPGFLDSQVIYQGF
jgi:hypothetical protein